MKKTDNSKLRIIPIGGLEQIGMNITAFEYEDSIIVVDCGLAFPEDDMLGIDLVIPDVTYLKDCMTTYTAFRCGDRLILSELCCGRSLTCVG